MGVDILYSILNHWPPFLTWNEFFSDSFCQPHSNQSLLTGIYLFIHLSARLFHSHLSHHSSLFHVPLLLARRVGVWPLMEWMTPLWSPVQKTVGVRSVWRIGYALVSINEVALRWAWLLLGWVMSLWTIYITNHPGLLSLPSLRGR